MSSWYVLLTDYKYEMTYDDVDMDMDDKSGLMCQLIEYGITSYGTDPWISYHQLAIL